MTMFSMDGGGGTDEPGSAHLVAEIGVGRGDDEERDRYQNKGGVVHGRPFRTAFRLASRDRYQNKGGVVHGRPFRTAFRLAVRSAHRGEIRAGSFPGILPPGLECPELITGSKPLRLY